MDYINFRSNSTRKGKEELIPLYPKAKKEYKGNTLLGMTTSTYFLCIYSLLYAMFLCCGAALFSFLEAPEERNLKMGVTKAIHNFLISHPTVTGQSLSRKLYEFGT